MDDNLPLLATEPLIYKASYQGWRLEFQPKLERDPETNNLNWVTSYRYYQPSGELKNEGEVKNTDDDVLIRMFHQWVRYHQWVFTPKPKPEAIAPTRAKRLKKPRTLAKR